MEFVRQNILTLLLVLPLAGATGTLAIPNPRRARVVGVTTAALTLALSLLLLLPGLFDRATASTYDTAGVVQLVRRVAWIPSFKAEYFVGVDGLSLPLVVLTTGVFLLATIAAWETVTRPKAFFSLVLLLETGVIGTFIALDGLLFFVFFELSLLPMYFLIGIWGGPRREYAALKFFIYTLVGSIAILVALAGIYLAAGSFDLIALPDLLRRAPMSGPMAVTLFSLLVFGFLVKLPAVPVHTWLPDAHVEASTPVSMLLAAVLLKLGGYGLLRIALPLFPGVAVDLWWLLGGIGAVSIVYGGFCALGQTDFKRLVAYSSVSHMGLVLLGCAMMTKASLGGAVFMMVAHGVTSAAMFFVVGCVYERSGTRDLNKMGGLWTAAPRLSALSAVAIFASLGLPGFCSFIGEMMVIFGTFAATERGPIALAATDHAWAIYVFAAAAALSLVLGAAYMLWTLQRVFFGPDREGGVADLSSREAAILTALGATALGLGVLPWALLAYSDATLDALLKVLS